jgi:hypothetical protein
MNALQLVNLCFESIGGFMCGRWLMAWVIRRWWLK